MRDLRLFLLFLVLVAASPGELAPYLIEDINTRPIPVSSFPEDFVALGDVALFQADRDELWRSDGTAAGTYRLVEPGTISPVANTGDHFFFRSDAAGRSWLRVTDGALAGTLTLAETSPGSPSEALWVPGQGVLYFISGQGRKLWRSDGTPGGTREVADIAPGPDSFTPALLTSFRGRVYFFSSEGLWRSDGTAQGTVLIRKKVSALSLHSLGSLLVFFGTDGTHGIEPWASDGTAAGTSRIADLAKGAASPLYQGFEVVGQRLFFAAQASEASGRELYVTDGTPQGTRRLTSFSSPAAIAFLSRGTLGNRLFFEAYNYANGTELWSSDGTPAGTRLLLDACPGACWSSPSSFVRHRGRLYYHAYDGTHGRELWVTDGTAQGTRMVKDLCPGECDSWPEILSASGDLLYVRAQRTLWLTDGTEEGTVALAELTSPGIEGVVIQGGPVGRMLIFSGGDADHGVELWCSNGAPEGTVLLADIADEELAGSSGPQRLMPVGESALFFARDGDGPGLWKSDGTAAGTALVKRGLSGLGPWTASTSRAFFVITGAGGLAGLWTSDGTGAGTYLLTPEGLGSPDQISAPVSVLGSRVFFSAQSPSFGREPWVTDGTPNGTRMLADLRPGFGPSLPKQFTAFRGKVWFSALSRLYRSDGTSAGTVAFGPKLDQLEIWAIQGGRLWFMGELPTGARRREVWSTDGTPAGTQRVGQTRKIPKSPVSHGGRLWFLGDGTDLWSTDGTTAGTRKVSLPLLLPSPVRPELIASDGARLYVGVDYFLANEEEWVRGVWASDGSASGTRQVSGLALSETRAFFNGRLYAVLYDGEGSRVLHRLDGTAAGTRPLRPDGEPDHVTSLVRFANLLIAFTSDGEIWQTDGTAEGTKLIREGLPHSEVVKAGPRLFFPAWEEETGLELWAMEE